MRLNKDQIFSIDYLEYQIDISTVRLRSPLTLSAVEGSKNEKDYIFVIRNQDIELVESGFQTAKEALLRAKSLADLRKQFD